MAPQNLKNQQLILTKWFWRLNEIKHIRCKGHSGFSRFLSLQIHYFWRFWLFIYSFLWKISVSCKANKAPIFLFSYYLQASSLFILLRRKSTELSDRKKPQIQQYIPLWCWTNFVLEKQIFKEGSVALIFVFAEIFFMAL